MPVTVRSRRPVRGSLNDLIFPKLRLLIFASIFYSLKYRSERYLAGGD